MPPRHLAHLKDIVDSAALILAYVQGLDFEAYMADVKVRDAVERRFAVIGEALNRLKRDAPEIHARFNHTA